MPRNSAIEANAAQVIGDAPFAVCLGLIAAGIYPGNVGELREVCVGRGHGEPVLAGERRKVSVRHKVSGWLACPDEFAENLLVSRTRDRNPAGWP